jgi:hypothetical protein
LVRFYVLNSNSFREEQFFSNRFWRPADRGPSKESYAPDFRLRLGDREDWEADERGRTQGGCVAEELATAEWNRFH